MKKHPLFFAAALLLVLLFGFFVLQDRGVYLSTLNSAPFRIFVLVRCAEFLLPAALCGIVGCILQRKNKAA